MTVLERLSRAALVAVLVVAAAYLLYRLRFVLIAVSLAAMLTYALLPLVEACARLRVAGRPVPRLAAVIVVFAAFILVIAGAIDLAAGPVGSEMQRLVLNVGQHRAELAAFLSRLRATVEGSVPPEFRKTLGDALARGGELVVEALAQAVRATAEGLSHVVEAVLVPILAFYFLLDLPTIKQELLGFLPPAARGPVLLMAPRLDRILAAYVRGLILLMGIAWLVVWVGLALMGIRYALLLGIIAGLTRAIPIIGPVLGAIPIVGLAMLESPAHGVIVLVFFVVLQVVESKVIMPQVIGHELRLHGVTILLALLVGNALFGLMGMLLAAPAAALGKEVSDLVQHEPAQPPGDAPAPGEG